MSDKPEQNDLQGSMAVKILQELLDTGKIDQEKFDDLNKKFVRLNDTLVQSFQNQKFLPTDQKKKLAEIKVIAGQFQLLNEKNNLAEEQVKKIQAEAKKAELEEENLKKNLEQANSISEKLKNLLFELEDRIKEEMKEKRDKFQPDIEQIDQKVQRQIEEKIKANQNLENQQKLRIEIQQKKNQYFKENNDDKNEIEKLYNEVMQIKDEPTRFKKKADMLQQANSMMNNELLQKNEEVAKKEKEIELLIEKRDQKNEKIEEYEKNIKKIDESLKEQYAKIDDQKRTSKVKIQYMKDFQANQQLLTNEINVLDRAKRNLLEQQSTYKKKVDQLKRDIKKLQIAKTQISDQIREYEMSIDKYIKEENEIKYEWRKQDDVKANISDEAKMTEFKKRNVELKTTEKGDKKSKLDNQISELEKQLEKLQHHEVEAMKRVKMLTAMRESMARKASSAMNEVRETREELKIKELLILDLTKKHQETEFKLNSFKALYEEVKSARNKYVNLIQNASQDLAELKERIKILQNELEILKNESQEKDSTLMQYKHILQLEIHKRDRAHARLNKFEYSRRSKKEQVDQNINEIEKLNMIIMALEKEMLLLKKNYEGACESRNFTGIQLIDRNDELCILYEKSNIQENILRNGETEIKKLEDEIRMIKIEMNEKKRQIDVARKLILVVPKLADKVIELKNQLQLEQEKEKKLSEELENPENIKRWRELKGEDPDQEALEAKIHVLEERLNNKKEQLLEKELILDEITNLSEKLRKQALEGRQSTLELSEKLNEFQAHLKDITRKMMSSISELSMYQATAIKLQQERDEIERVVEEAKKRMEESLPPTPETEIEYLKSIRDRKRYEEERQQRMQREALEKNFPPFATKTTAEHRVNAYIPDEIGIPKPYGKNAPFKPSEIGANFRHYRKPEIKEIEI